MLGYLNQEGIEIEETKITPKLLANMLQLLDKGTISSKIAKKVFKEILLSGKEPEQIVKEKGWVQISDENQLRTEVKKVIEEHPKSVSDYKNGKDRALGFLVGQVMKATKGKANPQLVNQLIREEIARL